MSIICRFRRSSATVTTTIRQRFDRNATSIRQWCGLRPSVLGQGRSETKKSVLVLVLQVWCCVVKHGLVTLVIIKIANDTATFQVLFIVSLFCACNITTVEINSAVHLLKSSIRQVPLFTSGGLGLVILVLVLRIWSCLHRCHSTTAVEKNNMSVFRRRWVRSRSTSPSGQDWRVIACYDRQKAEDWRRIVHEAASARREDGRASQMVVAVELRLKYRAASCNHFLKFCWQWLM